MFPWSSQVDIKDEKANKTWNKKRFDRKEVFRVDVRRFIFARYIMPTVPCGIARRRTWRPKLFTADEERFTIRRAFLFKFLTFNWWFGCVVYIYVYIRINFYEAIVKIFISKTLNCILKEFKLLEKIKKLNVLSVMGVLV